MYRFYKPTSPASEITNGSESDTSSARKTLPNTPTYWPAAAVLAGSLLALGGCELSIGGADRKKSMIMYSPSTNSWIYIPIPRSKNAVAVLSSTEILVIGSSVGSVNLNTIIKGTLEIGIEKI